MPRFCNPWERLLNCIRPMAIACYGPGIGDDLGYVVSVEIRVCGAGIRGVVLYGLPLLLTHRIPLNCTILKIAFSGLATPFYPWEHLGCCQVENA